MAEPIISLTMDPRKLFVDERLIGMCSYCGREPETRDHVPSRILLDDPFPPNLPVVEACRTCNESFYVVVQYDSKPDPWRASGPQCT